MLESVQLPKLFRDLWVERPDLFVRALGLALLSMVAIGLAVPALLRWDEGLTPLRPMLRRLFWVYGAYVLGTNLFFGTTLALFPTPFSPYYFRLPLYSACCSPWSDSNRS